MTKVKSPLLSLGATGTLANTLTFTRRRLQNIAEKKPIPLDPYTLPQAYHRWLYNDYCYQWTQQTDATKAVYKALATKNHTTPLAEWLHHCLTTLPGIVAWYHLDDYLTPTLKDSSKNNLDATNISTTRYPGQINYCRYFNGTSNRLHIPLTPKITQLINYSVLAWVNRTNLVNDAPILSMGDLHTNDTNWMHLCFNTTRLYTQGKYNGVAFTITESSVCMTANHWYAIAYVVSGNNCTLWCDGLLVGSTTTGIPVKPGLITGIDAITIGARLRYATYYPYDQWLQGYIDEEIIKDYPVTEAEIKAFSHRTYPPN